MFVSEKASAYGGFVLGILGLVGAGAIGSMVMNHRTTSFGVSKAIDRDISENTDRLEHLHNQVNALNDRIRDDLTPRKACEEQLMILNAEVGRQQLLLGDLRDQRNDAFNELSSVQSDGRAYRDRYRSQVRQKAIGEKIGDLITRSGKHFQNAEITDVSSAGMTIRHDGGMVRLAPSELDPKWAERFQWSSEELTPVSTLPQSVPAVVPPSMPAPAANDVKAASTQAGGAKANKVSKEVLDGLRHDVRSLQQTTEGLRVQLDGARDQAGSGRSRSVPGSIQTWDQRINELEKDLARTNGKLQLAKQKLAAVAPRDFLLTLSDP